MEASDFLFGQGCSILSTWCPCKGKLNLEVESIRRSGGLIAINNEVNGEGWRTETRQRQNNLILKLS